MSNRIIRMQITETSMFLAFQSIGNSLFEDRLAFAPAFEWEF